MFSISFDAMVDRYLESGLIDDSDAHKVTRRGGGIRAASEYCGIPTKERLGAQDCDYSDRGKAAF